MRHGTRCSTPTASARGGPGLTPISPWAFLFLMSDSSRTVTISVACGCIKPGCKAATLPATLTAIPAERRPPGVDPNIFGADASCAAMGVRGTIPPSKISTPHAKAALVNQGLAKEFGRQVMFTIEELATIPLFSTLGEKELEYLAGAVEDIHLMPGEYVAHEGEGRFLAVVVEGKTELTKLVNGVEQVIGVRLPGELGGEIPMTFGTPLPASMRAIEASRVVKVSVKVFHTLAAMAPEVSATVGAAALERLDML